MIRPSRRKYRPLVDRLDDRCLLATLTPAQIQTAYGLSNTYKGVLAGTGETIAIVDAYNDPNIQAELKTYDQKENIPQNSNFSLSVLNQSGGTTLPQTDAGWAQEEALDVEMAHALAPGANIVLVEASSTSLTSLLAAVTTAAKQPGVTVVSMSWGSSEFAGETAYDSTFTTPTGHVPVTFVASAGDTTGTEWPASSPNVVAVGGTTLSISGSSTSESAWTSGGGGYSSYESEPAYQESFQTSGRRSTPDVSFDADPNTGVAVFMMPVNTTNTSQGSIETVGGTSVGAPAWAAIIATIDQGLGAGKSLTTNQTLTALYKLPTTDFNTVSPTTTTTTIFTGGGFGGSRHRGGGGGVTTVTTTSNPVTTTGRGSPKGTTLISAVVSIESPTTTTSNAVIDTIPTTSKSTTTTTTTTTKTTTTTTGSTTGQTAPTGHTPIPWAPAGSTGAARTWRYSFVKTGSPRYIW